MAGRVTDKRYRAFPSESECRALGSFPRSRINQGTEPFFRLLM